MSFGGTALSFLLLTALLLPTAHGGPLDAPVITLGEKKSLFGEKAQANEYVSYALYYWPDPANPEGPYKPIDGKKNQRLRSMDDSGKMAAFIGTVCSLGRQYELNRDPRAASRAGEWLRAWFIAPATRMQPHLKYAQIRPGHRTEGDGGGIIDLYRMPDFLDALAALKRSGALTKEEWKRVDAWLNQYYAWLATSRQGRHAHTRSNNHYLFYVAQCAHLAHFLGRDNEARQWLAEAFANMDRHIAPDGSQPEELKRAEPWQYSVYTLQAWGYLVQIAERMGDKNYRYRKTAAGASIQPACSHLTANLELLTTWATFIPCPFRKPVQVLGLPAEVKTIFTPSSTNIFIKASISGYIKGTFTPKGLSVVDWHLRICSRKTSGCMEPAPIRPRPPALLTAEASRHPLHQTIPP